MIKVFKNFLSSNRADIIEKDLLGPNFEWYWNETTSHTGEELKFKTKNTRDTGQFIHKIMMTDFESRLYEGFKKVFDKISYHNMVRIKCNLNLNVTGYKKTYHQPIHSDVDEKGYKSLIYYINDSDGDTIFFNDKLKEIKRVNPKKGRAVIFDSQILHCGCNPIKQQQRGVINFIYKENENSILYR